MQVVSNWKFVVNVPMKLMKFMLLSINSHHASHNVRFKPHGVWTHLYEREVIFDGGCNGKVADIYLPELSLRWTIQPRATSGEKKVKDRFFGFPVITKNMFFEKTWKTCFFRPFQYWKTCFSSEHDWKTCFPVQSFENDWENMFFTTLD